MAEAARSTNKTANTNRKTPKLGRLRHAVPTKALVCCACLNATCSVPPWSRDLGVRPRRREANTLWYLVSGNRTKPVDKLHLRQTAQERSSAWLMGRDWDPRGLGKGRRGQGGEVGLGKDECALGHIVPVSTPSPICRFKSTTQTSAFKPLKIAFKPLQELHAIVIRSNSGHSGWAIMCCMGSWMNIERCYLKGRCPANAANCVATIQRAIIRPVGNSETRPKLRNTR